jgi:hypothetical protein
MGTPWKSISALVLVLRLMGGAPVCAEDKPTGLTDARAAVEANLSTPEGTRTTSGWEKSSWRST